jgi:hypothetical protein
MERMMAYLIRLLRRVWQMLTNLDPETLVGIGLNVPRVSLGPSGFMSNVSICGGPPLSQTKMTDRSGAPAFRAEWAGVSLANACIANRSLNPKPNMPSEPIRMKSRRPNNPAGT